MHQANLLHNVDESFTIICILLCESPKSAYGLLDCQFGDFHQFFEFAFVKCWRNGFTTLAPTFRRRCKQDRVASEALSQLFGQRMLVKVLVFRGVKGLNHLDITDAKTGLVGDKTGKTVSFPGFGHVLKIVVQEEVVVTFLI